MTAITPLRGDPLHRAIQERIKQLIVERRLQPGDSLPPEAQLSAEFGVGRNSVREAIKALQTLGVVESRHGLGIFVGTFSLEPLVDGLALRILVQAGQETQSVAELVDVRQVLESEYVRRATTLVTPDVCAELRRLVARMEERAAADEPFYKEDRAFHETLYRPLGNTLLVQLIGAFWSVFTAVRDDLPGRPPPLARARVAAHHRLIVDAVEAGDADAAVSAMAVHFEDTRFWLR